MHDRQHDEEQKHRHFGCFLQQDEKGNQCASKSNVRHLVNIPTIRVADPESDYFRALDPDPH